MRIHTVAPLVILMLGSGCLFADNLDWGGTYIANWDNFGTSPYTATDTSVSPNQGIKIFCLDFNDEIAPPLSWQASIMTLNAANVAGTGGYAGTYAAQYGGDYNSLVTAAFNNPADPKAAGETKAPQVSGPPFVFTGDTSAGAGAYGVTLTSPNTDAYTRYLEAAWLFTDIQSAVAASPQDTATDMIAQVAAWDLFVNASNINELTNDVKNYAGTYTFKNYLSLAGGQSYSSPGVSTVATSGLTFEQAVDVALAAAQNAVVNKGFGPGSYDYGSWSLVTGTPAYTVGYGMPVQEFLSPNATPDLAPVPEPTSIFLLGTIVAIWMVRRRGKSANRSEQVV